METGQATDSPPPTPAQRRIVDLLVALGAAAVAYALVAMCLPFGPGLTNLRGGPAGADSLTTLATARIALRAEPALAYDLATLQAAVRELSPGVTGEAAWPYPPTVLMATRLLGALPPAASLLAWLALIAGAAGAAGALVARRRVAALAGAASPASAVTLATGQYTAFGALGLAAFVRFLDRDPRLAGLALGLLALKPPLAMAAGALALLDRRWRLIAWAIATQLALIAASVAALGVAVWPAFVAAAGRQAEYLAAGRVAPGRTVAIFARLVENGASTGLALAVAVPVAVAAVLACRRAFRRSTDPAVRLVALAATTILAAPYAHDYDFALLLAPGVLLLLEAARRGLAPGLLALAVVVVVLPLPVFLLGVDGGFQPGALLAAGLLAAALLAAPRDAAAPSV